jgi:hypothetical protein
MSKEVFLLELVARVEDDWRQQDVQQDGRLEGDHVLDDVARCEADEGADEHAAEEGDDGFVDGADAAHFEVVRDPEGQDQEQQHLRVVARCQHPFGSDLRILLQRKEGIRVV